MTLRPAHTGAVQDMLVRAVVDGEDEAVAEAALVCPLCRHSAERTHVGAPEPEFACVARPAQRACGGRGWGQKAVWRAK